MLEYIRTIQVIIPRPSSTTTGKCLIIKTNKNKSKRTHPPTITTPAILTQPFTQLIPQTCLPEQQPKCPSLQANGPKRAKQPPAPITPAAQEQAPDQRFRNQAVTRPPLTTIPAATPTPTARPSDQAVTLPPLTTIPAAQATTRAPAAMTPKATATAARAPWS